MKYKRTQKRSKQMWQRVEKFSIRKFSIGVASCLIGTQIAISGVTNTAKADGITAYEANGDKVTAYAHGESVYKLRGTSTSIYNAFLMDVDTSKYTKENPIIKVTLTYNAKDNQTGSAPIFWSGRPMHWFTVPEATEELGRDYKLSLTNGSGVTNDYANWSSWGSNSRFVQGKNASTWRKNNDTTKESLHKWPREGINQEFNKMLGLDNDSWYDNSNMPTQDIMRDLRAKSNSIYIDWEKRAAGTVTVSYTTKVKDPEKTKEITIGMGVYQPSNAQQYARVETIKLPVLYKLNEVFEPKEPERTAVKNITNLDEDEIAIIREKIWAANLNNTSTLLSTNNAFKDNLKDSSNNGANSIIIDKTTGTATITYKDDTKDTIEGSKLIYKKADEPKPVTPPTPTTDTVEADGLVIRDNGKLKFYTNPLEVADLSKITPKQRDDARKRFKEANLTSEGLSEYDTYEGVSKNNLKSKVNFNLPDGPRNRASVNFRGNGDNFITLTNTKGGGTLGIVPRDYLFKETPKPAFDINAARQEANNLIDSLDNLYPNEKLGYKAIIKNAPDRDSIEREVNQAKAKANENAVELAKMKKEANDKINGLNYLTQEERENAINKINSATIKQDDNNVDSAVTNDKGDKDTNRNDTRDRLNSVVNELVQQDLQKARQKAIETINSIPNEDLSSDKKTDYINKINAASKIGPASEEGTILNIVEKAQKEASAKEAARKKEEADKVRQQYKDMIAKISGLTDEEKTEYNNDADWDGIWAIWDEPFLQYFAKNTGKQQPFLATVFTASSHHPYNIPDQYKGKFKKGFVEMHEPIQYTDYALKKYFETAKKQPWFENTIFVITGDHTNKVYYSEYQKNMNIFAVPLIFYSPNPIYGLKGKNNELAQQIDIYPTLSELIGYNKPIRSWGRSLISPEKYKPIIANSDAVQFQTIIGKYIYRFDGNDFTGIYDVNDLNFDNNLIQELNKNPEIEKNKLISKAWYQDYMHRIIHKKLGKINKDKP